MRLALHPHLLQKARTNVPLAKTIRHHLRVVRRRIDGCRWEDIVEDFQELLPASHLHQKVMNQRYSQRALPSQPESEETERRQRRQQGVPIKPVPRVLRRDVE